MRDNGTCLRRLDRAQGIGNLIKTPPFTCGMTLGKHRHLSVLGFLFLNIKIVVGPTSLSSEDKRDNTNKGLRIVPGLLEVFDQCSL